MRDPNRIPRILEMLEIVWRESPDLRLGQLLSNIRKEDTGNSTPEPIFNYEDYMLENWLEKKVRGE